MKQFEKLDFVLKTIAEHKKFIASKDLFEKINDKIAEFEFTPIVNKLFTDKYVEKKNCRFSKQFKLETTI
jgi:hypothetical protein